MMCGSGIMATHYITDLEWAELDEEERLMLFDTKPQIKKVEVWGGDWYDFEMYVEKYDPELYKKYRLLLE